ncbi:hypothetical protein MKY15_19975 [Sporosarcina sp. FSL K6-1540]|uniref:hypothetical protein n=1 Tax=Sporosarcina sp. FSL K6-1540 TaxID=2921555 RepID=UPI00315B35AA
MEFKSLTLPQYCPPSHAISQDLDLVYRFTDYSEVSDADFLTHIETGQYNPKKHNECEANAVSFFDSMTTMTNLQDKHPYFRRKNIASGKITQECGIHITKGTHINLWLFKNVDMKKKFLGEEDES